jgi:adenine-specific DNA-methyltransferase
MRSTLEPVQILRYMGNKTKIRDFLIKKIINETQAGETIIDLMAGTHAIGYSLKGKYKIISNDIQKYSYVIGKALIENNTYLKVELSDLEKIKAFYEKNLNLLKKGGGKFKKSNQYNTDSSPKHHPINKYYRKRNGKFPYCLFSYYFAHKYFPLKNCMKIDSLRYAIDKLCEDDKDDFRKSVLLICLLYAISYTVLTSGHFAQYRIDRGDEKTADLRRIRSEDVLKIFLNKAGNIEISPNGKSNKVFALEYKELLSKKKYRKFIKDASLVYLDPPYSGEGYSRYYHIAETLVNYDYPECRFKGCYRDDRFKSNFCKRTKAREEFENVINLVSKMNGNIKLLISYVESDSAILKVKEIKDMCGKYFKTVPRIRKKEHSHSSLGKKNGKVKEFYIFCKDPLN